MSECPDCDETGFLLEWEEDYDGEPLHGHPIRVPCQNWRHSVRPSLEQIADCLKRGVEPPRTHSIKKEIT